MWSTQSGIGSKLRVDCLALEGEDGEYTLMDPVERLPADEPFERLGTESKLADRERPLSAKASRP